MIPTVNDAYCQWLHHLCFRITIYALVEFHSVQIVDKLIPTCESVSRVPAGPPRGKRRTKLDISWRYRSRGSKSATVHYTFHSVLVEMLAGTAEPSKAPAHTIITTNCCKGEKSVATPA